MTKDIALLLEQEAARFNRPEFIADDPVQFAHKFDAIPDIEIASLLTAVISWGNRKMILRDADRMMQLMDYQPHKYVLEKGYEDLDPAVNIHRTFFGRHFQWFLRTLREVYTRNGSLDEFAVANAVGADAAPAWKLAELLGRIAVDVNGGETCPQCVPTNLKTTALKRLNMALRWFVRNDGIVDLGIWQSIRPAQLYVPLDVHVGNTARNLGLIERKANDRCTVELLTDQLRQLRPDDPAIFDYALFGIGIENKKPTM